MPYGSLHDQDAISPSESILIFQQCLSGLEYLHTRSRPITHRDIKPENILVWYRITNQSEPYICVKLSDFGLAKKGTLVTSCGTVMYAAPEIARGRPYTSAVDMWSLGVVILEINCGLPSVQSKNWCNDVAARARAWVNEELGNIVATLILMDPGSRLSASAALRKAIDLGPPSNFSHASQPYGRPLQTSQAFSLNDGYSTGRNQDAILTREAAPSPSYARQTAAANDKHQTTTIDGARALIQLGKHRLSSPSSTRKRKTKKSSGRGPSSSSTEQQGRDWGINTSNGVRALLGMANDRPQRSR